MRIKFETKGNFTKVTSYLERVKEVFDVGILDKYGKLGVDALSEATPVDTGLTASSWYYKIEHDKNSAAIIFCNSNIAEKDCPVAIVLQYGHATNNGGWVEGQDYINPAIRPVFEKIANAAWKEVTKT